MKLMDIDSDTLGIPETDYDASVTMSAAEFGRIVRDLSQLGESVRIDVSKEGIRFSSDGEAANGNVLLRQTNAAREKYKDRQNDNDDDEGAGSSTKVKSEVKKENDDVDMDDDAGEDSGEFKAKSEDEDEGEDDEDMDTKKKRKKAPSKVRCRTSNELLFNSSLYRVQNRPRRLKRAKTLKPKAVSALSSTKPSI